MITRRELFVAVGAAGLLSAQQSGEIATPEKDTFVILFEGDTTESFGVGVRTSVKADESLVQVFYEIKHSQLGTLLLSKSSIAPVAGTLGYGATRENFTIPRKSIKFIRVTFFDEVAKREAKVR